MARRLCHLLVCTPLLLPSLEGRPLRLPETDSWVGPKVPGYGIVFVWHGISPKGLSQRHNLSTNWGQRDVQLYLDTFTAVPKAILCQACNCSDHITDSRPFPPVLPTLQAQNVKLLQLQQRVSCALTPCPYTHQCNKPGCTAAHPEKDQLDSSSSGSQPKTSGSSNFSWNHTWIGDLH